jgi:FKBP-type peptidyl-prolyl cis-trans isomerase
MINKFEFFGIAFSVVMMAIALYLLRIETSSVALQGQANLASVSENRLSVPKSENKTQATYDTLKQAVDVNGNLNKMIIDDITLGKGEEVQSGDTVTVHYAGTLPDGQEFDNSHKRGEPFAFKVGEGKVIKGWEEGLLGMKVGGKRILVIPPDLAYGNRVIGPIPANSTLVFSIELLEVTR